MANDIDQEIRQEAKGNRSRIFILAVVSFVLILMIVGWLYYRELAISRHLEVRVAALEGELAAAQTVPPEQASPLAEDMNEEESEKAGIYEDIIAKITALDRANPYGAKCTRYSENGQVLPEPVEVDCVEGKVEETDISQFYYLKSKNIVIVLVPGIYGGSGFKLLKYDVASGTLSVAVREDIEGGPDSGYYKKTNAGVKEAGAPEKGTFPWFNPPNEIDSYNYTTGKLFLSGDTGDAGCFVNSQYEYDPEENYLRIVSSCTGCDGETESCIEY